MLIRMSFGCCRPRRPKGDHMLSRISTCLGALILFIAIALPLQLAAQSHYSTVELGELGGTAGSANGINDRGWITGTDNLTGDVTSMATLWVNGSTIPLGTLGGPNSAVAWPVKNNNGVIVGISELADADPLGENFSCWPFFAAAVPTGRICKGFRWQNGQMIALPPFPGGYSSYATGVNNRGQVVGWAENGVHDPTCDPSFQILQFRAATWGPNGDIQELPPLPGDSTSAATAINDQGQVVGISGDCGVAVGSVSAKHAVLWENGKLTDLNALTVSGSPYLLLAGDINQSGVIVGEALDLNTLQAPAYVATPLPAGSAASSAARETPQGKLPDNVRQHIERRM